MNESLKIERKLLLSLGLVIFFPTFKAQLDLRFEQIFLFGLWFWILFDMLDKPIKSNKNHYPLLVLLVTLALLSISVLRGFEKTTGMRDLIELAKPLFFFTVFYYASLVVWDENNTPRFIKKLFKLLLLLSLYGVLEANVYLVNELSNVVYKDSRGAVQYKAVGAFIVPYVYAALVILPIFYYLMLLLIEDKKKIRNIIFFLVAVMAVVYSQSRTIFLSLMWSFFIFFIYVSFFVSYEGKKFHLTLIASFLMLIGFFYIVFENQINERFFYLYSGLSLLFDKLVAADLFVLITSSPSIENRYEQLRFAIDNQDLVSIIGVGIGKYLFMPESFYALNLYRIGLIGMLVHLAVIYFGIKRSYSNIRFEFKIRSKLSGELRRNQNIIIAFFSSAIIYFMSLPVSYLSSSINEQTRSGYIFYVTLAIVFAYSRKKVEYES